MGRANLYLGGSKKNVEVILQAQANELKERLGATKLVLPKLPIIPLGIHTADFAYTEDDRTKSRTELRVSEDTLVVLYAGRLSFHAKAHPLTMYQALEEAALTTGKDVLLIECGWHANKHIQEAFSQASSETCPSVRVMHLDGRESANRDLAWSAADVFCSLSDNIQETFGIVPIEAMAAGLPVIVTDWDGYKDSVRDGVDGFRIPTMAPSPGLAGDLALRHAVGIDSYDMYCGYASSLVSINMTRLISAFVQLFSSSSLRLKMGDAGRARAQGNYDWKVIIDKYELLWSELAQIRLTAQTYTSSELRNLEQPSTAQSGNNKWAARLDPTIGFENYPTQHLSFKTKLIRRDVSIEEAIYRYNKYKQLSMVSFANYIFPTDKELRSVLTAATKYPQPAERLLTEISSERMPYVLRSLSFLCKICVLEFI